MRTLVVQPYGKVVIGTEAPVSMHVLRDNAKLHSELPELNRIFDSNKEYVVADIKKLMEDANKPATVQTSIGEVNVFPENVGIIGEISQALGSPETLENISDDRLRRAVIEVMCHKPEKVIDKKRPSYSTILVSELNDNDISEIIDVAAQSFQDTTDTTEKPPIEVIRESIERFTDTSKRIMGQVFGWNKVSDDLKNSAIKAAMQYSKLSAKIGAAYGKTNMAAARAAQEIARNERVLDSMTVRPEGIDVGRNGPDLSQMIRGHKTPTEIKLEEVNESIGVLQELLQKQNEFQENMISLQKEGVENSLKYQNKAIVQNKDSAARAESTSRKSNWISILSVVILIAGTGFNIWSGWGGTDLQRASLQNQELMIQALEENNGGQSEWQDRMLDSFNDLNENLSEQNTEGG